MQQENQECFGEHVRVQIAEDVANAIEEDY